MFLRGTRLLFLAVVFAMAFACASADAAPIAGVRTVKLNSGGLPLAAFDGSDIYWTYSKDVNFSNGFGSDTYVKRTSFLDGSTVPILYASAAKGEDIDFMDAGGGVVAIGLERDGTNPDDTEAPLETDIIRVNRDGTNQQVIAAGKQSFAEGQNVLAVGRKAKLNDCGSLVELSAVGTTGEVFYANDNQERESSGCGGKPNVNKWTYNGVALDGTTRTVLSVAAPVHSHFRVYKHGGIVGSCDCGAAGHRYLSVAGDWALAQSYSNTAALNLSTGAIFGPYVQAGIPKNDLSTFSIDTSGRVIAHGTHAARRGKHRGKRVVRTTIFPVAGDPQNAVRVPGDPQAFSCGVGIYSVTGGTRNSFKLRELDPNSGAVLREVGQVKGRFNSELSACGSGFLYLGRAVNSSAVFRAIPLH